MSEKQRGLFDEPTVPNDSHGVIDPEAELYTDGVFRVPGAGQEPLAFAVPFAESRSMRMRAAECRERSRIECDRFADSFAKGQPDIEPEGDIEPEPSAD